MAFMHTCITPTTISFIAFHHQISKTNWINLPFNLAPPPSSFCFLPLEWEKFLHYGPSLETRQSVGTFEIYLAWGSQKLKKKNSFKNSLNMLLLLRYVMWCVTFSVSLFENLTLLFWKYNFQILFILIKYYRKII